MKSKTVLIYPDCPKCGSCKTGQIKCSDNRTRDARLRYRNLLNGVYIKYVNSKDYYSYYRVYNLNMYCEDCNYEFEGKIEKVQKDSDFYEEYQTSRGCMDAADFARKNDKAEKKLKRIKNFFKKGKNLL